MEVTRVKEDTPREIDILCETKDISCEELGRHHNS